MDETSGARGASRRARRVQMAAQARGAHVGPHGLDVREALGLRAAHAGLAPAGRHRAERRPDRVLFFIVDDDRVDDVVGVGGRARGLLGLRHDRESSLERFEGRRTACAASTR
ncbi:hypothetical protein Y030_6080 [Burkholderia pseudomallei MSHR332]|nr:hypothetical protein Y030_6080 [Burkholderia pseudomallei MSHR332]